MTHTADILKERVLGHFRDFNGEFNHYRGVNGMALLELDLDSTVKHIQTLEDDMEDLECKYLDKVDELIDVKTAMTKLKDRVSELELQLFIDEEKTE